MRVINYIFIIAILFASCEEEQELKNETPEAPSESYAVPNMPQFKDSYRGITIITEGPRGGTYAGTVGGEFSYRVFRITVVNDTLVPAELKVGFPHKMDSLLPGANILVKAFLLPPAITPAVIKDTYNFGVKNLDVYLDTFQGKPVVLDAKINPGEKQVFYVATLLDGTGGLARAMLFTRSHDVNAGFLSSAPLNVQQQKETDLELIFGIGIDPPNNRALIPCGQIVFQ